MFMQRAIDCESPDAAVENTDGKRGIHVRTACGSGRACLVKFRQFITLAVEHIINRPLDTSLSPKVSFTAFVNPRTEIFSPATILSHLFSCIGFECVQRQLGFL